ncbi:alpha/beta hydrolase [uncultured Psychroserpens sp.]|uniref:alpha/beta hydrolase n=1 Tax=uncultured Psychroserpens sp. TaxID=255436 RepID=UPI0026142DAE|nr:alpha/beta hydrolase [uncultured Psychroserpens sp.]
MKVFINFIFVSLITITTGCKSVAANNNLHNTFYPITDYNISGSGPDTLLLIPCMSCRWNEWETFMEKNKEKYTMFAITIPGFGGTPEPKLLINDYDDAIWRGQLMQSISAFIDENGIKQATVVGHSWGVQLAIQIAAIRADVFKKVIAVDGTIESTSVIPKDENERIRQIKEIEEYGQFLAEDPEEWRKFNRATYQYNKDTLRKEDVDWALKLHGSFMATSKVALIQYWRENLIVDLDFYLHKIKVPILNIQSFAGKNQEKQKEKYFGKLQAVGNPANVTTVILYDTYHFIMQHRPEILDQCIWAFIKDIELKKEYRF